MMKKILATSLVVATLMFSGCGSDSEGEVRLETQQMLDSGDYTGVIAALENTASTDSDNMKLGAAYMGSAGLSFADLVSMVADASSTTTAAPSFKAPAAGDDTFAKFADKIQDNKDLNPKALELLTKAIERFKVVTTGTDVKLFLGLAYTAKATTAFSYLGNLVAMIEDNPDGNVSSELVGYGCAISEVYANVHESKCTSVDKSSTTVVTVKGNDYIEVTSNVTGGYSIRKLMNTTKDEVILTDGYCLADGTIATESTASSYACPVGDGTITLKSVLEDTLNDGFDVIASVAPADVKADVEKFKTEIGVDATGRITMNKIAEYVAANVN